MSHRSNQKKGKRYSGFQKFSANCIGCGKRTKVTSQHIADPYCPKCLKLKLSNSNMLTAITKYKSETNANGEVTYDIPITITSDKQVMGALSANAAEAQRMGAPWMTTEFVENGADAFKQLLRYLRNAGINFSITGEIIIVVDEKNFEVRIIDNGTGILDPIWVISNPFQSMKAGVDYLVGNFGRGLTGFRGLTEELVYITLRDKVSDSETKSGMKIGKCVKISFGKDSVGKYVAIDEKEFKKYTNNKTGTVAIIKNWKKGQWDQLLRNKRKLLERMQLHFGHALKPDNLKLIIRTISDEGTVDEDVSPPDFSSLQPLFVKTITTNNGLAKTTPGVIKFSLYKTLPKDDRKFKEPYLLINNRPLQNSKISDLEDFESSGVWKSPYVTGYVECDYVTPNQLRSTIEVNENRRVFITNLLAITKDIEKELSDYMQALRVKNLPDDFKEIKNKFSKRLKKMKIKWNKTAFKKSGKLIQGKLAGKLSKQGKLSQNEGGVNEGLIAEDGTDIAIISKQIQKRPLGPPGPGGPGDVTDVLIKDPKGNGKIPLKDGRSQKLVRVKNSKTSRGGTSKKSADTEPDFVPQYNDLVKKLCWYEPTTMAIIVNTGFELYKRYDTESTQWSTRTNSPGFSPKMKQYLLERYAWEFFMEFGEGDFHAKAKTYFLVMHDFVLS